VHADVSVGESAMRDSARFHFGFVVPYVGHFSAQAAVERWRNRRRSGAGLGDLEPHAWWSGAGDRWRAKDHRPVPFSNAPTIPPHCRCCVISRVADDAMVTEVSMWSVRVSG